MQSCKIQFTAIEPVNLLLGRILQNVESILGGDFIGAYLFGSLAVGDFDPATSDIDVVVVSRNILDQFAIERLTEFHQNLFRSGAPFSAELECYYVSKNNLHDFVPGKSSCYKVDRGSGEIQMEILDADWTINSFSLLNHGIRLAGPRIHSLIAPVSTEMLKGAVSALVESWWLPMASTNSGEKLMHPGYRFYAILTMARMLATCELGKIISKAAAARYASTVLEERWKSLVEKAQRRDLSASVEETQEFIRYTRNKLVS